MITDEQNRANLKSAANVIRYENGFTEDALTNYETRNAYNTALANYIVIQPEQFTPATVAGANAILARGYQPQSDPFDISDALAVAGSSIAETSQKWGFQTSSAIAAGVAVVVLSKLLR